MSLSGWYSAWSSLLVVCGIAEGAVVWVNKPFADVAPGVSYVFGLEPNPQQLDIDINSDGQADLRFMSQDSRQQVFTVVGIADQPLSRVRVDTNINAVVMQAGDLISIDYTLFSGTNIVAHYFTSSNSYFILSNNAVSSTGNWLGQTGYLGILFSDTRLVDGEIVGGDRHFGWIRMSAGGSGITFHEWAYETDDMQPILAGQIPEPGTVVLTISGSFLMLHRRRPRRPFRAT